MSYPEPNACCRSHQHSCHRQDGGLPQESGSQQEAERHEPHDRQQSIADSNDRSEWKGDDAGTGLAEPAYRLGRMARHGLNPFGSRFLPVDGKLENAPNDEPHQGETKDHRPNREEHGKHGQDGTRQDYHAETQKSQPTDLPKNDPSGFQVFHDDNPRVRGNSQQSPTIGGGTIRLLSYSPAGAGDLGFLVKTTKKMWTRACCTRK